MADTRAGIVMGRPLLDYDPKNYREQWAINFRMLRLRKFDSQDEFRAALEADGIKVIKATVSHWERGYRLPAIDMLPHIALVLGVKVQRLVPDAEFSPADRRRNSR